VYRTLVISRDPAILKQARRAGAFTFGEGEKLGLNVALVRGSHVAAAQGASSILVLPADLPFISVGDIETLLSSSSPTNGNRPAGSTNGAAGHASTRIVAITPDRTEEGTNALFLCPPLGFDFQFGPGSFRRHMQEAERLGIACRVVHAPGLKFDIDTEEDWRTYLALRGASTPAA
jgi:2-phospho-L-lactate guanylyltransferase